MTKPTSKHVYKSAEDGKFVTKKYADDHPKTTFKERVQLPKSSKGK